MNHSFSLRAEWTGNRGTGTSGYKDYDRDLVIQADGPGELQGSAARAFHGAESRWNPEQLLLAALTECHLLSYLHSATQADVVLTGLACRAEVTLETTSDGSGQITSAVLRPEVWLAEESQREQADALHHQAHERCFIARSVNFPVQLEPEAPRQMPHLPEFSSRLGAPIAVLRPREAKRPSQVTGLENRPVAAGTGHTPPFTRADGSSDSSASESVPVPAVSAPREPQSTFYDQVGGHETFAKLCRVFYEGVAQDPLLKPMYPEEDLGPAEERLLLFLEQYWGGPRTYSEQRGHPRLRMRHMPYTIDFEARDAWLRHMRTAVDSLDLAPLHEHMLWDYLERAAHSMVNSA